jgi:hypothetical protein
MARTHGQMNESTGKVEKRKVGRHRAVEFPVTDNSTRAQRVRRALIG